MTTLLTRLEPRSRSGDLAPGLAARLWDPCWLLARQWVLGEFDGEDAGTPVSAGLNVDVHRLSTVHFASGSFAFDPVRAPLDALVERMPVRRPPWTARLRLDVGRELLHRLREAGLGALWTNLLASYAVAPPTDADRVADPEGARLLDVAHGRLPDGEALYRDAASPGTTPSGLTASSDLSRALDGWREWLTSSLDEPSAAGPASPWDPQRFEAPFGVSADSLPAVLRADGRRTGGLDWYSFDQAAGGPATSAPQSVAVERMPTPVRFSGMPSPRYWEFEDAAIDFGSVDAAASDLARLALLEFAFVYGNDVFALPVRLPFGSISVVTRLVVSDTFGIDASIPAAVREPHAISDGWSFFALSGASGSRVPALLLPPVAQHQLRGPALEEVSLARDEMANMAWAVEARVEGGTGRARVRAEDAARALPPGQPPSGDTELQYQLRSEVPSHWFPLVLQAGPAEQPRMLMMQALAPSTEGPKGRVLPPVGGVIHEEEVPREGLKLVREPVLARWVDGSTRAWVRVRRETGRGEASSGLRFDIAQMVPRTGP